MRCSLVIIKRCLNKDNKNKEWINEKVIEKIKLKIKYYKIYKKYPTIENKIKYNHVKNHINKTIKECKYTYYSNLINKNIYKNKQFWKICNRLIGGKEKNKEEVTIQSNTGKLYNKIESSEILNTEFSKLGKNTSENRNEDNKRNITNKIENNVTIENNNTFNINKIEMKEIEKLIEKLKNKSPGPDNIPANILKIGNEHISKQLLYFINYSIKTGWYPESLKINKIIPLYYIKMEINMKQKIIDLYI